MKRLNFSTYIKLLKQGKENLILLQEGDKIYVTNKKTGKTYFVTKGWYDSHRERYDIPKSKNISKPKTQSTASREDVAKNLVSKSFSGRSKSTIKVPKDPWGDHRKVHSPVHGAKAVKNAMQQYGGGGGQEGFDDVWKKHEKKVTNLVGKILKKAPTLTYHDLGNLVQPPGQYTQLDSGEKTPKEFEDLQYLMSDIADQAQENYTTNYLNKGEKKLSPEEQAEEDRKQEAYKKHMKPVYDEYWRRRYALNKETADLPYTQEVYDKYQELQKWREKAQKEQQDKFDWKTGKPKTESKRKF